VAVYIYTWMYVNVSVYVCVCVRVCVRERERERERESDLASFNAAAVPSVDQCDRGKSINRNIPEVFVSIRL